TESVEATPNAEKLLPVIIKADTLGSLEAIIHEIRKLDNEKVAVKIISQGVGPVSESDVKTASASKETVLLAFNVKTERGAFDIALRNGKEIQTFGIIYELTKWLADWML